MAEIEIEKKKPVWPWVLVGIIIVALIGYLIFDDNDETTIEEQSYIENTQEEDTPDEAYNTATALDNNTQEAINTYSTYLKDNGAMSLDHEYSHAALARLIASVDALAADVEVDVTMDMEQAHKEADYIMKEPSDLDHANKIKSIAQSVSKAISKIQSEKYPNLNTEAQALMTAADGINPDIKTLNQKGDVTNFFQKADELLTKIK